MKKITKIFAAALCAALTCGGAVALPACGESGDKTLTITGSTSVQPLMQTLAAAYEEKNGDVVINVGGGGSSVGVSDVQSGKSDIGMTSRELKSSETGVISQKIADDGIALIVNKNCTVTDVTTAEVKALYESGTAIQNVIVAGISRSGGSGTRDAFEELVGIESLYSGTGFEEVDLTNAVITSIKGNSAGNTVGYISLGSLNSDVKALKYNGAEATSANVSAGTYALARPFNILYGADGLSELAQDFIDFILSAEGQAIVSAEGYISVA